MENQIHAQQIPDSSNNASIRNDLACQTKKCKKKNKYTIQYGV